MVTAQQSAAGVPPVGMAFLDAIAKSESSGRYDVVYGGGRVGDLSRHPGKYVTIQSGPNKGKKSSAAGRYQFLERTWNQYANKLGLKDFSKKSQDRAAWELAKDTYKAKTGGDLQADLESGDPKAVARAASALSGVWTSLPKGIEQGQTAKQFATNYATALSNYQETDFNRGGLLSPNPGGVMGAVAATLPESQKGKVTAAYQQAANTMKDAGISGIGGGLLSKAAPASAAPAARGSAQAGIGGNSVSKATMTGSLAPAQAPAPSPANLAAAYGLLGRSLADANQKSLSGALADPNAGRSPTIAPTPAPAPAARAIQQVAPVQRQALVQPIAPPVPRAMPVQRAMPVAPAPVARSAPAQSFGPPMATAMDVWSGRAPMGMANNGNVLSERNGNVYSYNPTYDRTSIFNAAGDVVGSFKGREQQGLLGTDMAGFGDKLGGMFAGRNSQFGDKARAVTGAVAGGLLGNYVAGPLGGAIGAALGKEIAAGRNPFEGGLKGLLSAATGRGSFPEAPPAPPQTSGPGLGTNLSQQAKDAIAAGKGGLY